MSTTSLTQLEHEFFALAVTCYTKDSLKIFVQQRLNVGLEGITSYEKDLLTIMNELIQWTKREGRFPEFVSAVASDKKDRNDLQNLVARMKTAQAATPDPKPEDANATPARHAIVNTLPPRSRPAWLWSTGAAIALAGAFVLGVLFGKMYLHDGQDEWARVLDQPKSFRYRDTATAASLWGDAADLEKKMIALKGADQELASRVFCLGPFEKAVAGERIQMAFPVSSVIRYQVYHRQTGTRAPVLPLAAETADNPVAMTMPACAEQDKLFIFVSIRPASGGAKSASSESATAESAKSVPAADNDMAWRQFTCLRRLP